MQLLERYVRHQMTTFPVPVVDRSAFTIQERIDQNCHYFLRESVLPRVLVVRFALGFALVLRVALALEDLGLVAAPRFRTIVV